MQDSFPLPSCFSSFSKDDPLSPAKSSPHPPQSLVISLYRTKIAGLCRLITITWCRNILVHTLSISVSTASLPTGCKVELRPWHFWRKHGSKQFDLDDDTPVHVFWDLRTASFSNQPEPRSNYYVAIVSNHEVVLLLGDHNKEAYRRTNSRPALIDATLVAKKEHLFGKKRFSTRAKFHEKGRLHDISIEYSGGIVEPEMVFKIDGHVAIQVKHLEWKFRGNQSISINKNRVEVYWDVHDWLFSPGLQHARFIFKPVPSGGSSLVDGNGDGSMTSNFCLFLYAWKLE